MNTSVAENKRELPVETDWLALSNFAQTWTVLYHVDKLLASYGLEIEAKQSSGSRGETAFRLIPRESS